jgi:hypothetical protein
MPSSPTFRNVDSVVQEDLTRRYEALCAHYRMIPTRSMRSRLSYAIYILHSAAISHRPFGCARSNQIPRRVSRSRNQIRTKALLATRREENRND